MEFKVFQYKDKNGWDNSFPDMDSEQTLVIIFAAPDFFNHPEPIMELAQFYKQSKIIGCSSAGEIYGSHLFDNSLSVAVIKFSKTKIKIVKSEIKQAIDSYNAGVHLTQQLKKDDLTNIFVLSDGLNVNGAELAKGMNEKTNNPLVVTGGLAADGSAFKNTWTIFNGEILTNHIVAVGFYGKDSRLGYGSKGGWDVFGPARRITRSDKNILYELDNQPVLQLYKEYLGDYAANLPASGLLFPLAIKDLKSQDEPLVRTILSVDEATQSLIFAGDVPLGQHAQLMRANFDRIITSAAEASELARNRMFENEELSSPALVISISCVGRRLLLGERTEEEIEATLEGLPSGSAQIGFYSYGELSPLTKGDCKLHNQTMTLTILTEN